MTGGQARHRFLLLLGLRWLPVGLTIPISVLLPLDRGLALAEIGLAASVQGFVVLALELPTGGLADSWGRRPVLTLAASVCAVSIALLAVADSFAMFVVVYLLQGVYRALDSGPLEAWYVDAARAADPDVRIERGLSAGGTVIGLAVGSGALATGGIVAWVEVPGVPTLVLPVLAGLVVQLTGLVATVLLVRESPRPGGRLGASLRAVPATIVAGVRLVRRSRILLALVAVELFWGFGMVAFETLMPVRLAEQVGGPEAAAAITGPTAAAGWLAFGVGSALIPLVSARLGTAVTAAVLRVAQGIAVLGLGLLAGPVGVLTGYLVAYVVHGASSPLHATLLHREVDSAHRATVVSVNSMMFQPAYALGLITLTAIADGASVGIAIVIGAVVLAVAAPLYLPAARAERARRAEPAQLGSPGVLNR